MVGCSQPGTRPSLLDVESEGIDEGIPEDRRNQTQSDIFKTCQETQGAEAVGRGPPIGARIG
jgi:hypothetical protein